MRRATKGSWLWLVTAVVGLAVGGQGCDLNSQPLNPQPLPPNEDLANGSSGSGSGGGATSGASGGPSYSSDAGVPAMIETDASTGTPNVPPDGGNSATDGGAHALVDGSMSAEAGEDGEARSDGEADAALDASGASDADSASDAPHASDAAADGATDAMEGGQ